MMMILWYRHFAMSNSSLMPVPIAVMIVRISSLESTLSKRAFSTLMILPRSGRMAWKSRLRPCLAEPPAESPSTRYISQRAGSEREQSASLPGSAATSSADFLRVRSRALRAASRARAAEMALSMIALAVFGCSSRYCVSSSFTTLRTAPSASELPSLVFVCPSNCGSRTFTDSTAVMPSRTSSPESRISLSFLLRLLERSMYLLITEVSALLKPVRCVPPSCVLMLLTKENVVSE